MIFHSLFLLVLLVPSSSHLLFVSRATTTGCVQAFATTAIPLLPRNNLQKSRTKRRSFSDNSSRTQLGAEAQQQQPTRPVVVLVAAAGNKKKDAAEAAQAATLGAALGLGVRDALARSPQDDEEILSNPPAAAQPVTLLTTSGDSQEQEAFRSNNNEYPSLLQDFERVLQQIREEDDDDDNNSKPIILHVVWDAVDDDPALLQLLLTAPQVVRDSVAFLGLHPVVVAPKAGAAAAAAESKAKVLQVPPDAARNLGTALQQVLDSFFHGNTASDSAEPEAAASVAWGWPVHLAMLRANCLPKWPSSHDRGGGDSYLILPSAGGDTVVLVDYLYDYGNPFGGTDPLSCPTREVAIGTATGTANTVPWTASASASCGAAAAYTALRGNGVDAVEAACIASGVGATLSIASGSSSSSSSVCCGEENAAAAIVDGGSSRSIGCDPAIIERAAQLAQQFRDRATTGPVVRQKYIEFGYK